LPKQCIYKRQRKSDITFKETIRKYCTYLLALLIFPVTGMVAALGIVAWRPPKNVVVVVAVIFFLMVQYVVTVFLIVKRIDSYLLTEQPPSP
jgi:polyferredoxin